MIWMDDRDIGGWCVAVEQISRLLARFIVVDIICVKIMSVIIWGVSMSV